MHFTEAIPTYNRGSTENELTYKDSSSVTLATKASVDLSTFDGVNGYFEYLRMKHALDSEFLPMHLSAFKEGIRTCKFNSVIL